MRRKYKEATINEKITYPKPKWLEDEMGVSSISQSSSNGKTEVSPVIPPAVNAPTEFKTYTVKDIQNILKIGKNQANALFNQKDFPSVRIGNRHYVSEIDFITWFNGIKNLPNQRYFIS